MIYYLTLLLIFWALIYSSARFLKYFRIVKDYKDVTEAEVVSISDHIPASKREPPGVDVVLEYTIAGKEGRSEITVPREHAGRYEPGNKIDISYHVSENGSVHIASAGSGPRRMMYGYLGAIILELIIYAIVWRILL